MNRDDTARLLAVASGFDNRKPDPDVVTAWSVALASFDFTACRDAVVKHYQRTRDWVMPFDIIAEVKRARAKLIAEDVDYNPPAGLDPDDTGSYARWLIDSRERAARGEPPLPMPPASIRGSDVVAELGNVGATVPSEAREAVARAKSEAARSEGAKRALREAKVARLAAAREADRKARAGESEEVAS